MPNMLPVPTKEEIRQAETLVIKDQVDMIRSKNIYSFAAKNCEVINFFYDRDGNQGKWREAKIKADTIRAEQKALLAPWEHVKNVIDKAQKVFINSEDEKKREQERLISESLTAQAEEQKQEKVAELLVEGREEEAQQLAASETKKPVVNLKTDAVISGQHTRKNYKIIGVDLSKLPDEYTKRVPDYDKLNEALDKWGLDLPMHVPGVEVKNDFSIVRK